MYCWYTGHLHIFVVTDTVEYHEITHSQVSYTASLQSQSWTLLWHHSDTSHSAGICSVAKWHSIKGKRTVWQSSTSFHSTVQCQHSQLIVTTSNVMNYRINFHYKTSVWFQELTEYQQHEQKITWKGIKTLKGFIVHNIQTHSGSKNERLWLGWQRSLQ